MIPGNVSLDLLSIVPAEAEDGLGFIVTFQVSRSGGDDFAIPVLIDWDEHIGASGSIKDIVPRAMAILHRELTELVEATRDWAGPEAPED
jgi:hypothetical protein